jgi:hypothetical protein
MWCVPHLSDHTMVADGDAAGGMLQRHTTVATIHTRLLGGAAAHRHNRCCLLLLLQAAAAAGAGDACR